MDSLAGFVLGMRGEGRLPALDRNQLDGCDGSEPNVRSRAMAIRRDLVGPEVEGRLKGRDRRKICLPANRPVIAFEEINRVEASATNSRRDIVPRRNVQTGLLRRSTVWAPVLST